MRVCIIGAGFSGIAAAVALRRSGVSDLVIVEQGPRVGGTWRDNTYPGCACDVQSRLYELAVAPWPGWSRRFASQPEIEDYLERVVEIFNLGPQLRLGTKLTAATWTGDAWHVETTAGEWDADVLVSATGGLVEPEIPRLPGSEVFQGKQMHTARWDAAVPIEGKRVAVIGTGASAIQVVPAIAPIADEVVVFQRTAPWILPRRDRPVPTWYRALLEAVPPVQRAAREATSLAREISLLSFTRGGAFRKLGTRTALGHLRRQVSDDDLRRRLTPDYELGCKRVLLSDDFYPAMTRPDVTLAPAAHSLTADGVVDAQGVEHPVDVVIWATGFQVMDPPVAPLVRGEDGRTLAQVWAADRMSAHRGTTVPGFPNFFILMGPNTALGHSSVVLMSEAQIEYVRQAVERGGIWAVRPEALQGFVTEMDKRLASTVWQSGGCQSWYQDGRGRNIALWPGSTRRFARLMRRFDGESYQWSPRREHQHAPA